MNIQRPGGNFSNGVDHWLSEVTNATNKIMRRYEGQTTQKYTFRNITRLPDDANQEEIIRRINQIYDLMAQD